MEFIKNHMNNKHLILVPTILLAEQFIKMFNDLYNITTINGCYTNTNKDFNNKNNIYICVYNSFDEYIKPIINEFNYIFIDEAHHIVNKKYNLNENNNKIYEILNKSNNIKYYFSATLIKNNILLDYNYNMNNAINDNIICDFDINVHILKECNDISILNQLKLFTQYKRILIYCNSIQKIKSLCKLYNKNNLKSDYIDSSISIIERINKINKLKNNEIRILFSVNTLSEGIDIKCCDTCLFLDDRNSIINIIQCIGRILRKFNDK